MNNIKNSFESLKAERPIEVDLPVKTQKSTLCCAKCDIQHPQISKILHTEINSKKIITVWIAITLAPKMASNKGWKG